MKATDQAAASGVFKAPNKTEKGDATTRAARDIIDRETAERDAKTARLRALRLAKEAEEAALKTAATKPAAKKAPAKTRKAVAA